MRLLFHNCERLLAALPEVLCGICTFVLFTPSAGPRLPALWSEQDQGCQLCEVSYKLPPSVVSVLDQVWNEVVVAVLAPLMSGTLQGENLNRRCTLNMAQKFCSVEKLSVLKICQKIETNKQKKANNQTNHTNPLPWPTGCSVNCTKTAFTIPSLFCWRGSLKWCKKLYQLFMLFNFWTHWEKPENFSPRS